MELISRKDAAKLGLKKYFTGEPCKNGHNCERYVTSGSCQECITKSRQIITESNGEIVRPLDLLRQSKIETDKTKLELLNRRMAIQEMEAENERRRIALKEQSIALKIQSAEIKSKAQITREAKREHKQFLKEHLVPVNIQAEGEDYHVAVNMVWMAALIRNPCVRKEDILTGRRKDGQYVMRCFPEDKLMLCKQTNDLRRDTSI